MSDPVWLTAADPEPTPGSIVRDSRVSGLTWMHLADPFIGMWVWPDSADPRPESWASIAGHAEPLRLVYRPPSPAEADLPTWLRCTLLRDDTLFRDDEGLMPSFEDFLRADVKAKLEILDHYAVTVASLVGRETGPDFEALGALELCIQTLGTAYSERRGYIPAWREQFNPRREFP